MDNTRQTESSTMKDERRTMARFGSISVITFFGILNEVSAWCQLNHAIVHGQRSSPLPLASSSPPPPSSPSSTSQKTHNPRRSTLIFLYQNDPEEFVSKVSPPSSSCTASSQSSASPSPSLQTNKDINSNSINNSTSLYFQDDETPPLPTTTKTTAKGSDSSQEVNSVVIGGGTLGDIMSGGTTARRRRRQQQTSRNDYDNDKLSPFVVVVADDDNNNNDERNNARSSGSSSLLSDGLVTSESESLSKAFGIYNPLDRIAVTANGNLQRLFSSYYDTPVRVHVEKCERRCRRRPQSQQNGEEEKEEEQESDDSIDVVETAVAIWDRRVLLTIFDNHNGEESTRDSDDVSTGTSASQSQSSPRRTVLCTADSTIYVHDEQVESLVESGKVGIGQLFRHYNTLPDFQLLEAGRCHASAKSSSQPSDTINNRTANDHDPDDTGFWRRYLLKSDLVTCDIHEVFCPNLWGLTPPPSPPTSSPPPTN